MTHFDASRFPELRRVFEGYLHEDFLVEYGSPAAAIQAFHADAGAAEQRLFRDEARRFMATTSALDFTQVQRLVTRLGSRWIPGSREELAVVLAETRS
jgi:hypothetical protein